MAIHFTKDEFRARRRRLAEELEKRSLQGILLFKQESMYYLTGYETFGYCFFQCLYVSVDDEMFLLTRSPDLRQAHHTSVLEDVRVWVDGRDGDGARALRSVLDEYRCKGTRLGVESDAYGLSGRKWDSVRETLDGFCELEDASTLVTELRAIKSDREIDLIRTAATLADNALDAAIELVRPGMDEGRILAAMQGAVFEGGGDYPGNEFIIGSDRDALLCRYHSGRRQLAEIDQLTIEFAGVYRRYHACLMRTVLVGQCTPDQQRMFDACLAAMEASVQRVQPGATMGAVFDAHAGAVDQFGFKDHRLNACGYSLGATFTPTWMDYPMFYHGNDYEIVPGMVLFLHMILMNSDQELAMTLGQTVLVEESGASRLSRHDLSLIIR